MELAPGARVTIQKQLYIEFLKSTKDFEIDNAIDNKLLITVAPDGYLKRIS